MHTPFFPPALYHHLATKTLTGIKAGVERTTFRDIWLVNAGSSVFAHSRRKRRSSWFTNLLQEQVGLIKSDATVIDIKDVRCTDQALNLLIDQAYRQRYQAPENLPSVICITQPEYAAVSIEFMPAAPAVKQQTTAPISSIGYPGESADLIYMARGNTIE